MPSCLFGMIGQQTGRVQGLASAGRVRGLLEWLDDPVIDSGLNFAGDGESWDFVSYGRLAGLVHAVAGWIACERRRRDGPVAIVLPTGPMFPAVFYGTLVAGSTPCPLAPPNPVQGQRMYIDYLANLLHTAQPSLIVTEEAQQSLVDTAAARAGLAGSVQVLPSLSPQGGSERRPAPGLALLQFTSGSSGRPRGARVTWENLVANMELIRGWARPIPEDVGVTFLPMFHDMGLISSLLLPTSLGTQIRVMRPEQFIANPLRWLACFGLDRATAGSSPTFGLAYARRHIPDEMLAGMDFSRWRIIGVGAERIDAAVLSQFLTWLEPHGLRASVFAPAYGLAEATLAVTGGDVVGIPPCVHPDWAEMREGAPVSVKDTALIEDRERIGDGVGWLVSCGQPHPGMSVAVVGAQGEELPDGCLGELFVTGPSVVSGYVGGECSGSTSFERGGLMTGDAGFKLDGELYVCGRIGDSLNVLGRKVYAEDLEARISCLQGVGAGRCVVLTGAAEECDRVVLLVQGRGGSWVGEARAVLRSLVGSKPMIKMIVVPRKAMLRTSSGKPRRRAMWQAYLAGEYDSFAVLAGDPVGT